MWSGRCQPRDIVSSTSVRLTRRALEGGPVEPSNAFPVTTQGYAVTSGRRERSPPLLSALCGHPRHCSATPGTATTSPTLLERTGTGRRHACHCTSYGPLLTAPSSQPAGSVRTANLYTTTSKSPLYGHRTRHDAPTGARFTRTVANSAALLATPPHIGE
jgi:hypothetical protein